MTALTTRDALTKALHEKWQTFRKHMPVGEYLPIGQLDGDCRECGGTWPCTPILDALIASGAVIDAATLADDEALVTDMDSHLGWVGYSADALRALAAALTERAS